MERPKLPRDEAGRLEALVAYGLLDTPPEQALDDLVRLAGYVCAAPISLISLVDADRQWFKAKIGLELDETSRETSFCGHAVLGNAPLVVPDASRDPRFHDNPLVVDDPNIRFYAGAPLVTPDGHAVGTLCVMDRVPREMTPDQLEMLSLIGRQVVAQFELRLHARDVEAGEARLLTVFRSCPVAVTVHRWSDRQFVDANEAFSRMTGWSRDELVGRTAQEVGLVETASSLQIREKLIAGEVVRNLEMQVVTRTGARLDVLMGTEFVELHRERHAISTFIDVTERKAMEIALRQSEGRYRKLFEHAPDGILIADGAGTYLDANETICGMLGLSRDELIGKSAVNIVAPSEVSHIEPALTQIATGDGYQREWQFRRKDGTTFRADVSATPLSDGNLLAMVRDVTEQRRVDARFRRLVDSNAQGVYFWNAQGQITAANDAFLGIVGFSHDDLRQGRLDWATMTPPEFAELDRRALEALATTAICKPFEKEYVRRDGTRVPVLLGAATFDDDPGEGVAFVVDLTDRKRLESQFLRAQRLESIGTLAGGIAHDLNNVLAPIVMSMELLRPAVEAGGEGETLEMLESSAQRATNLVQQLLLFARGAEGRRVALDLGRVIREVAKVARETFPKSIDVQFTTAPDLWATTGDPTQLHQVLLNLCVNARDAMPQGGVLNLGVANVVLDETFAAMHLDARPGPHTVMTVEDTGSGIPDAIRDRLFEPFFTTKEVGHGTGLGLSTSLAIVKSHGGFIHLYSEVGRGTRFRVFLPAAADESAEETSADLPMSLPRGSGETVLVVDDEIAVRTIAQRTLERFGYRVVLASNGAEAIAAYVGHKSGIDVVLTDMTMPVMDGPATIVALRALDPDVKIIGTSGLATNDGVTRAVGAGVERFVPKPFTAESLLQAIREMLQSR